jgi:hypothetical protein
VGPGVLLSVQSNPLDGVLRHLSPLNCFSKKFFQDGQLPLDAASLTPSSSRMFLEWDDKAGGKRGDPIVHAFVIPHDDLRLGEIAS